MAKKKKDGYLFAGLMFLAAIPIMGGSKKNPPAPVPPKNPSLPPGDIYDVILKKESAKYGLDYRILKAIMAIESDYGRTNWYVTKTSGSGGAAGLFAITDIARTQVNQNLGTKYTRNDLWKPEISIICAANLIDYWRKYVINRGTKTDLDMWTVKAYKYGGGNLTNPNYTSKAQAYYDKWKKFYDSYK